MSDLNYSLGGNDLRGSIVTMRAEIERLRAALKEIVDFEGEFSDRPSSAENSLRLIAERAIKAPYP